MDLINLPIYCVHECYSAPLLLLLSVIQVGVFLGIGNTTFSHLNGLTNDIVFKSDSFKFQFNTFFLVLGNQTHSLALARQALYASELNPQLSLILSSFLKNCIVFYCRSMPCYLPIIT